MSKRNFESFALHFGSDVAHFVERGRDQAGEADDVGALGDGGVEDLVRRRHHAEVDDVVIVALKHDADDVLADIVHIALDGGEHDLAVRRGVAAAVLLLIHVGHEIGDGLFHHPRRLHHLGQKHPARAEQVADHVHAVHQRPFDHGERTRRVAARFLDIGFDEVGDAVHQRVRQPLLDRPFAPRQIGFLLFPAVAAMTFRDRQQTLGRVGAAVERDILARRAQFGVEIVVDRDLAGIDDTHVHAGGDGVSEKHRVHRLAHRLVAAERKREVRDAAGDVGVRKVFSDPARRLDEGDAVAVVLLHAGGDGKDVRIKNDVLRREADAVHQDVVGARANRRLALERVGLARLVERHDDDGRTIAAHDLGMMDEAFLAFLERDGIHDRLALNAFEAGLDHGEFRGIDHHRHAGDVGFGRDQIEERDHGLLGIEQAFVHVDVDDLGAVLDLVAGDGERCGIIAARHELPKTRRSGDVGAFADVDERNFSGQREGFEAGQPQTRLDFRKGARRLVGHGLGNGTDVIGRGAAAAADDVDEAGRGEFADQSGHGVRAFVIMAEFVGQAGVGIGADERVGDASEFGDVGAHLFGAERAIEPDRQRRGMRDRIPEGLRRLPGEEASGAIRNRARYHHRQTDAARFQLLGDGVDRRLGVERIENGLDQQRVDAAVDQPAHLLRIGDAQLVEGDGAEAGIGDVGRDRRGAIGRTDGAGNEALATILVLGNAACFTGEPRAFQVQFVGDLRHAVIGLRDTGRGERVGGDDVGAGAKIREMDGADRVRPAEIEEIVVAAHLAIPGIEARTAKLALVEIQRLKSSFPWRRRAPECARRRDGAAPFRLLTSTRTLPCDYARSFCALTRGRALLSLPGRTPSRWQIA